MAYAIGAFWPRWMKPLEIGNVASAVVVMAVTIALFTPIADPARLSVDDQMRRLASGRVTPEQFDVEFLRFDGARYGQEALRRLQADQSSETSRALGSRAREALAMSAPRYYGPDVPRPRQPYAIAMHPTGVTLPEGFASGLVNGVAQHLCIDPTSPCDGYLVDLNGDGVTEVIVGRYGTFFAYGKEGDANWVQIGQLNIDADGEQVLRRGEARVVPALVGDLMLGDTRVTLNRQYETGFVAAQAVPDDASPPNR